MHTFTYRMEAKTLYIDFSQGDPAASSCVIGCLDLSTFIGMTEVDWEGMETTGIDMYTSNDTLYRLLYDTMTGTGTDRSVYLEDWCSLEDLVNNAAWDKLFR